jgi:hypothetical protein
MMAVAWSVFFLTQNNISFKIPECGPRAVVAHPWSTGNFTVFQPHKGGVLRGGKKVVPVM